MDLLVDPIAWLLDLLADFSTREPTEQITIAITILGFVGALLALVWKTFRLLFPRKRSRAEELFERIEKGDATPEEIEGFARRIYQAVEQRAEALTASEQTQSGALSSDSEAPVNTGDAEASALDTLTNNDDERLNFVDVVKEMATSDDAVDREVILKYARGDRDAALATLEARAKASKGEKAATVWGEVAALARPFNQTKSVEALEQVLVHDPSNVRAMIRLARAYRATDLPKKALEIATKAVTYATDPTLKARALVALASAERANGELTKAADTSDIAEATAREAAAAAPSNLEAARVLANAFEQQSSIRATLGEMPASREAIDKAIRLYDSLLEPHGDNEDLQLDATLARFGLAFLERRAGDLNAAINVLTTAEIQAHKASQDNLDNLWLANAEGEAKVRKAFCLQDRGDEESSLLLAREAEDLLGSIVERDPAYTDAKVNLLWAQILQTRHLVSTNRTEEALERAGAQVDMARATAKSGSNESLRMLSVALWDQSNVAKRVGNRLLAEESIREAVDIAKAQIKADPANLEKRRDVLIAVGQMANVALESNDYARFRELALENLEYGESWAAQNPGSWFAKEHLIHLLESARYAEYVNGNLDAALGFAVRSRELAEEVAAASPDNIDAKITANGMLRVEAAALAMLGNTEVALGKAEQAYTGIAELVEGRNSLTWGLEALNGARAALAVIYIDTGRFNDGIELLEAAAKDLQAAYDASSKPIDLAWKTIGSRIQLSRHLDRVNENDRILKQVDLAEAILPPLSNDHSGSDVRISLMSLRSTALRGKGEIEAARRMDKEMLAFARDVASTKDDDVSLSNVIHGLCRMADWAIRDKKPRDAQPYLDEALSLISDVKNAETKKANRIGVLHHELSRAMMEQEDAAIRATLVEFVEETSKEAAKDPKNLTKRMQAAFRRLQLAQQDVAYLDGPLQFDPIMNDLHALAAEFPEDTRALIFVSDCWSMLATSMNGNGWYSQAKVANDTARDLHDKVIELRPDLPRDDFTGALHQQASDIAHSLAQNDEAVRQLDLAEAAFERYMAANADKVHELEIRHRIHQRRAAHAADRDKMDLAERCTKERIDTIKELCAIEPENRGYALDLADALSSLHTYEANKRNWDTAGPLLDEIETLLTVYDNNSDSEDIKAVLKGIVHRMRAEFAIDMGRAYEARQYLELYRPIEEAQFEKGPSYAVCQRMAVAHMQKAQIDLLEGSKEEAVVALRNSEELVSLMTRTSPDDRDLWVEKLKILYFRFKATEMPEDWDAALACYRDLVENNTPLGNALWMQQFKTDILDAE